jgi:hypothetical protein
MSGHLPGQPGPTGSHGKQSRIVRKPPTSLTNHCGRISPLYCCYDRRHRNRRNTPPKSPPNQRCPTAPRQKPPTTWANHRPRLENPSRCPARAGHPDRRRPRDRDGRDLGPGVCASGRCRLAAARGHGSRVPTAERSETSSTGAACGAAAPKIVSISSIAVGMSSAGARRSAGGRSCCASLRGSRRKACVDAGLGSRLRASKRRCSRTSNV